MKKCSKCKESKDKTEFHKETSASDGLSYRCKSCARKKYLDYKLRFPDKIKESARKTLEKNKDAIRASQKRHNQANREIILERRRKKYWDNREDILKAENSRRKTPEFREYARNYQAMLRKDRKELVLAWQKVTKALKSGKLVRASECVRCGSTINIEGHHMDYAKPLDVLWVCSKCHKAIHSDLEY